MRGENSLQKCRALITHGFKDTEVIGITVAILDILCTHSWDYEGFVNVITKSKLSEERMKELIEWMELSEFQRGILVKIGYGTLTKDILIEFGLTQAQYNKHKELIFEHIKSLSDKLVLVW